MALNAMIGFFRCFSLVLFFFSQTSVRHESKELRRTIKIDWKTEED